MPYTQHARKRLSKCKITRQVYVGVTLSDSTVSQYGALLFVYEQYHKHDTLWGKGAPRSVQCVISGKMNNTTAGNIGLPEYVCIVHLILLFVWDGNYRQCTRGKVLP